jgi:DNA-binding GntR family transcriptional regulator
LLTLYARVSMRSAYDVYKIIREEIIQGKLNPGERLVEKELCDRLGTTRGYVREALKLLGADSFVILNHGKGATVAKLSYQETKDLYELLAALEAKSVELAAPRLDAADLEALLEINKTLKTCISAEKQINTMKVWQDANMQFHRMFAERSGNRELMELVENIRWRTFDFRFEYFFEPYYEFFVNQHASLIAAIQNKNFSDAKKIMEDHIEKASQIFLDAWKESRF